MQNVIQKRIQDEPREKVMRPTSERFDEYCDYAAYMVGLTSSQVALELRRKNREQKEYENVRRTLGTR